MMCGEKILKQKKLTVRRLPGKQPAVFRCHAGREKTRGVIPASTVTSRCCSLVPTRSHFAYLLVQKIVIYHFLPPPLSHAQDIEIISLTVFT